MAWDKLGRKSPSDRKSKIRIYFILSCSNRFKENIFSIWSQQSTKIIVVILLLKSESDYGKCFLKGKSQSNRFLHQNILRLTQKQNLFPRKTSLLLDIVHTLVQITKTPTDCYPLEVVFQNCINLLSFEFYSETLVHPCHINQSLMKLFTGYLWLRMQIQRRHIWKLLYSLYISQVGSGENDRGKVLYFAFRILVSDLEIEFSDRHFRSPYQIGIVKMLNVLVRYRYTQVVHHCFREYPHFFRLPLFPGRLALEGQWFFLYVAFESLQRLP